MNLVRFAILALVVIPACDSPGGGGNGGLNCSVSPNHPLCLQADTAGGETSAPNEVVSPETAQVTTAPDTQVPQDTQVFDTTPPQDTTPPECSENSRRCNGNRVELCASGSWLLVDDCGGDVCSDGSCVVQPVECTGFQRQCNGSSVEQCNDGQWAFSESCPSGCSDGNCAAAPGGGDCNAVLDCADVDGCFASAPDYDSTCWNGCLAQGSTTGRSEASAMIGCFDSCGWDGECAYETCSPQRVACYYDRTGSGDCASIDDCIGSCADTPCIEGCFESASARAQADYEWLVSCIGLYCDRSDSECVGSVLSGGGPCEGAYLTCFGG